MPQSSTRPRARQPRSPRQGLRPDWSASNKPARVLEDLWSASHFETLVFKFETLREARGEFGAVSDDDEDRFGFPMNIKQQVGDDLRRFLIEIAGWLVAQQQLRFHDQRARKRDALFLAA